ncbi:MAG: sulfatase-like hydrolase/transferase [Planctomycetes bacterium]|nr:sulfatase-like hydrolase/transferase [Planctomycetota bacterium]
MDPASESSTAPGPAGASETPHATNSTSAAPLNIVWICSDDFTPDVCGAYGNRQVATPHLDRLASQGLRFDRAFATAPLSTPSRQSFWTGRYPRSIGVTMSRTPLPADEVTLPVLLRNQGYEIAAFGKTHFYAARRHEFDVCRDWTEYQACLDQQGLQPLPRDKQTLGTWRPFRDPPQVWLNSAGLPYTAFDAEMFGTYLATQAAGYLANPPQRPFFMHVGFRETHSPFHFPIEFQGRYDPRSFHVPEVTPADRDRLPEVFQSLTEADKQGIVASYATCTEFMDRNMGIVLDALDRSPALPDTLVIFTSDHGYLLGQHGRFEKHCCFDPAIRTALLMRLPGGRLPGRSTSALVSLHDLVPTILELAGVPRPENLQSESFAAVLQGTATQHRERIYVEYADNEEAAIRTDRWKFIYSTGRRRRRDGYIPSLIRRGPWVELYDLASDPDELQNLADHRSLQGLVNGLTCELAEHLVRTARDPRLIPRSHDVHQILECALPPRDQA